LALSRQPSAYNDCYEIWAAALTEPGGVRTNIGPNYAQAEYLRARMHQARSLLRDQTKAAYKPGDPAYNTSEFDAYKLTIKIDADDDTHWLYVEPHGNWSAVRRIEPVPEDERIIPVPAPTHRPLLTHRPEGLPNANQ
jgi:hypothetical protein